MSRIGVVTVTYNSGSVLEPFLDCCLRQQGADFALYVIDNDSRDATRSILARRRDPRMHVVLNDANLGVAEGNNQGIRLALEQGCDQLLLINNDVEFSPTLFADLQRSMTATRADALTPRIVFHDQPDLEWFVSGRFKYFWGPDARHDPPGPRGAGGGTPRAIEYAPTCCMLVSRRVFDRIGLMDPEYFVYWDDTDFCLRLQRAGLSLYCDPGISMSHKVSSLTGGTMSDFFIRYHHRNQIYYVRKHFGAPVVAYTLMMSLLKALIRVPLRGDTARHLRLRLSSMRAGLRLPLSRATGQ